MMNLSFAGCGFLGIYHVGVAVCFKKYAPHLLLHRISGASAGALAATCLLCDMPLGEMTSDFFRVVNEARSHSLGPFSPSFNIQTCLLEGLQKFLPPNAHEMVSGKLHVSLTRVYDGKNVIVSQFNSREDLLQALLCACFIPGFSGILPPRFHGVRYMDGAFSDNLPILDENTVTVSPFCGESDICPRDQSAQLFHVNWANTSIELSKQNMNRFARILFPPKAEILSKMCQQGFDDALQFLHRNNLISCTRCLAVQSTFIIQETVPEPQPDFDPECTECKKHRKDALVADMPETVLTVFQTYIEAANKGLANWIFKRRGVKLLQTLSLPATLPADFVYATLSRLLLAAPAIGSQLWSLSKFILTQLNEIIIQRNKNEKMAGNLSCKIRMNEYGTHQVSRSAQVDIIMSKNTPVAIPPTYKSTTDISQSTSSSSDMVPANQLSSMPIPHDCDAFEHILQVTMHQDAVYAYYYMDENNKVKVTEIFDMSESSDATLQTTNERDVNTQLQFDNDWNLSEPDCMFLGNEDSIYNAIDNQQHNNSDLTIDLQDLGEFYDIFHSNAETAAILDRDEAWTGIQIEEVPSDPESDQHHYSQLSESASNALNRSLTQTYQYTNN